MDSVEKNILGDGWKLIISDYCYESSNALNVFNIVLRKAHILNKNLTATLVENCSEDSSHDCVLLQIAGHLCCEISHDLYERRLIPKCRKKFPEEKESVCISTLNLSSSIDRVGFNCIVYHQVSLRHNSKLMIVFCADNKCCQLFTKDFSLNVPVYGLAPPGFLSMDWLEFKLFPRILKWMSVDSLQDSPAVRTLQLVNVERYAELYEELKSKYAPELISNWPERTDPLKYVYEDIAIATYIILLWESQRNQLKLKRKQSFIDLGCGNGLLVYILIQQGFEGKGVDIRSRNVWKNYPPNTVLEVRTITPTYDLTFSNYDWIIGNHSDELTPWIPLFASRSSYTCSYIVIPCCPFDFTGRYIRRKNSLSQYREYLDYIEDLGSKLGFYVQRDMLKIPSMKRVCFVGWKRSYPECEESLAESERASFLAPRLELDFAPRKYEDEVKKSRRLFSLEEGDDIAQTIFLALIADFYQDCLLMADFDGRECGVSDELGENNSGVLNELARLSVHYDASVNSDDVSLLESVAKPKRWFAGKSMSIKDLVALFPKDRLTALKEQCGGLKTLIKSYHHVFRTSGNSVRLHDWSRCPQSSMSKKRKLGLSLEEYKKTRLCWFHSHHPQGCPLVDSDCHFAHGIQDLRQFVGNGRHMANTSRFRSA